MSNYADLKAAIANAIKYNDNHEITGEILQEQLLAIINAIGEAGYIFAGVATQETNPGSPDSNVVYLAGQGTYANFGATNVEKGHIGIFAYNGSWDYEVIETGIYFEYEEYPQGAAFEFTFYNSDNPNGVSIKINKDVSGISNASDEAISQWWAAQIERKINVLGGYTISIPSLTTSPQTLGLFKAIQTGQIIDSITGANKLIFGIDGGGSVTINASDLPYKATANLVNVRTESGTANNVSIVVRGINDILPAYININEIANHPAAYASATAALSDVPALYRRKGVKVVYLDDDMQLWIEMVCQDDAGVNWWTDIENNWAVEGPIETKIATATGGQQLNIAGEKRGNLDDVLNVNAWNEQTNAYDSAALARAAVPAKKRKLGAIITYLLDDGWFIDQFNGSNISDWNTQSNWISLFAKELFLDVTKISAIPGTNLINPDQCLVNMYITPNGLIRPATDETWCVTGFILVNGQDIISNAFITASAIGSYSVYDKNGNRLRTVVKNAQYTYQEGDYYVRFCINRTPQFSQANYGTTLQPFKSYTAYKPLSDLAEDVEEINESLKTTKLIDDVSSKQNIPLAYLTNHNISRASSNSYSVDYYPVEKDVQYLIRLESNINTYSTNIKTTLFTTSIPAIDVEGTVIVDPGQTVNAGFEYLFTPNRNGFVCLYKHAEQGQCFKLYTAVKVSRLDILEDGKLNKIPSENLINPDKLIPAKYITSGGSIGNGERNYYVTDLLPVNGNDIISNGVAESYARAWVVYDANGTYIRHAAQGVKQYTYQSGDEYIRFGFWDGSRPYPIANIGTELNIIPYSDYKPVAELEQRVEAIESEISISDVVLTFVPHILYRVWNDIDVKRQNIAKIGLSRLLSIDANLNQNVKFNNGMKFIPLQPVLTASIVESNINIQSGDALKQCVIRNTPANLAANIKPRILVIGDSVTSGYGANSNKIISWHPNQYWAYTKMLFEMDKIDNGDTGHDALFVGGVISNGTFTIQYKNISREVRVKAEGKGGASLDELFNPTWGDNHAVNPFYDETNETFSIQSYLDNYRTMDDLGVRLVSNSADPHGETVTGSDGLTYTIGQKITSQTLLANYDVCTPTHIFMNLNHNTTEVNFTANIANVVNIVKTELPNVVFGWLCIDSTGTNFPADYPNFEQSIIRLTSLHTKNNGFYKYFHDNIENENNNIYLLGMNFIQPEAIDYPFTEIEQCGGYGETYKIANRDVLGANYHPNNIAHAAWGYELYAFIKWLISKDL